jgi:hypothetical protein
MEVCAMAVPAGALLGCILGAHQLGDHLAIGRVGDAQIAVFEEVAQSIRPE